MSRKAKKIDINSQMKSDIWTAGLYVRLSKEDGDKEVSNSINNQIELLNFYLNDIIDVKAYDTYIDDGYTGTNFKRPEFKRMIQDVENKKINCIIAKDLSRLGRDYIGLGDYLENYFPDRDIRVIIVNDNLDSYKRPDEFDGMVVQIKNLFNQQYAKDISRKIRAVQDIKRKKGEFIGPFAPYGYIKEPCNKNNLVIDEKAAVVVKQIYSWLIEGYSQLKIVYMLNELEVPCPLEYKRSNGQNLNITRQKTIKPLWSVQTVNRILCSEIYIGNMVQKKTTIKGNRQKKQIRIPKNQWIIVENTHEPIINHETFDLVQNILGKESRKSPAEKKIHIFSGMLRCADCGRIMNRQKCGEYYYYVCTTYKMHSKKACSRHGINVKKLESIILTLINNYIYLIVDVEEILNDIEHETKQNDISLSIDDQIHEKKKKLSSIDSIKTQLYTDWKINNITKEEFLSMKNNYDNQCKELNSSISKLYSVLNTKKDKAIIESNCIKQFRKYGKIDKLDRELVVYLIDEILVHENKELTITFKFKDEFEKLAEQLSNTF